MFLGIDWGQFASLSFWAESNPGTLSRTFEIIFIAVLVIGYGSAIIAFLLEKKYFDARQGVVGDFWRKVVKLFIWLSVIFTFIFFFRAEGVPYLGGRYMFLAWGIALIIWTVKLAMYYFRGIPKKIKQWEQPVAQKPFENRYTR